MSTGGDSLKGNLSSRASALTGRAFAIIVAASMCMLLVTAPTVAAQAQSKPYRTFSTPEEAVRALAETVKAGKLEDLLTLFAPDGQELVASSDPATGRRNREIFSVAFGEGWRLVDQDANHKVLVIGNEGWPFPVPLVKDGKSWRFDTAAGKEEVLARRIGRNELAVIGVCRTYVVAQRRYAQQGHDGKPAGLYAKSFNSDPGKQNGLFWTSPQGQSISPLGDLVAQAAEEGRALSTSGQPAEPFYGYYYKILTGQGPASEGGARSYIVNGEMTGGFALVAWPAQYDASGVMTFIVNQSGIVFQKDLGPQTDATAKALTLYDPKGWHKVQ
jgi:hypothetical protein